MTLSRRPALRQGVGGTNNLLPTAATDNISREKNKQTTHLKRRNSPPQDRTSENKPSHRGRNSKINHINAAMRSLRHWRIVLTKGYKFQAGGVSRRPYLIS